MDKKRKNARETNKLLHKVFPKKECPQKHGTVRVELVSKHGQALQQVQGERRIYVSLREYFEKEREEIIRDAHSQPQVF